MTALTTPMWRLTAAALVAATVVTGGVASAASADEQAPPTSDYVEWLLARAESAKPYSQGDDYVRTLVYWHHNPDWGFGS